jgi:hypothetical protein
VAGVDGVAAGVVAAFLFFFTCFLATGAVLGVGLAAGAAGAWAASDSPAAARVKERPRTAEVIVFMVFVVLFLEAFFFQPLYTLTRTTINHT